MDFAKKIFMDRRGLVAAGVAVLALGATAGITLGGFSATIANPTNTFSSGTVQLEEGVASTDCFPTQTAAAVAAAAT